MSDDWDTVTKIGSKVRSGNGGPRETVIRGKSALNAAQRSGGVISTEKKAFGTGNATSKPGVEGQRLTKVANSDDVVAQQFIDRAVAGHISRRRQELGMKTQRDLANKSGVPEATIKKWELPGQGTPDNNVFNKLEKVLKINLRGANIGQPKTFGPKKAQANAAPAAGAGAKKEAAPKTTIKIVPPGAGTAGAKSATPKTATPKSAEPKSAEPKSGEEKSAGADGEEEA